MQRVTETENALPPEVLSLLTALPGTAIVIGRDGRILRAGADALGWRLCDTERLLEPRLIDLVERQRLEGILVKEHLTIARSALHDSSRVDLHVQVAPLAGGNSLLLIEDETDVRRAEQMRHDFIGNVSHELKTPIGAISLLTETLADSAHDPEAIAYFTDRLKKESKRLTNLVQDIISLSQLQDRSVTAHHVPVALDGVISEAIELCSVDAARMATTIVRPSPCPAARISGTRKQLVTAIRNIIDNAIRYSPPESEIKIFLEADDARVSVIVIDQGIGIAPDERERIFERFYRIDTARSRETGGTGLGLSIVKHVMIEHGGQIHVWSAPGGGSTFTLVFPRLITEEAND